VDVVAIAAIGAALSDPTRLKVLDLTNGKRAVGQIAAALNLASTTVSHHLNVLARGGLITVVRRGRRSVPVRVRDVGRLLARALQ
jgi:DNA-binding transcriptional ArsR family regulator